MTILVHETKSGQVILIYWSVRRMNEIERFRLRRAKRLQKRFDVGIDWITTENGAHVPVMNGKSVGGWSKGKSFNDANKASEYTYSNHSVGGEDGQTDMRIQVKDKSGKEVGYCEYSDWSGRPHIQMIKVNPEYRRQGIAKKMLQELQSQYKGVEIDLGMLTPDGVKLVEGAMEEIEDKEAKKKIDRYKAVKKRLEENEKELNGIYERWEKEGKGYEDDTEENKKKVDKLGEEWDRLYEEEHKLGEEVKGLKSTKRMVKM